MGAGAAIAESSALKRQGQISADETGTQVHKVEEGKEQMET